jgi:radical SAM family uncharacterized protein
MKELHNIIEATLPLVSKPARYIGNEVNSVHKDWNNVETKVLLAFPDIYEIGMSHVGLRILYHILNSEPQILCERVFAPWTDFDQEMRQRDIPLFSLESWRPARDFDIVGFSLQYEIGYSNVLNMLDLAGIPLSNAERTERSPLVIAGGPCAFNPEPMARFFEAFVIGDGEDAVLEVASVYRLWKGRGATRRDLWRDLAKLDGVYVPELYEARYDSAGRFRGLESRDSTAPSVIKKRTVADLDAAPYPTAPIVPFIDIVHDRLAVEIMRGCPGSCRFCQATTIYSPARERSVEKVQELIRAGLESTGYEEISLTSLSSTDHGCIGKIIKWVRDSFGGQHLSVSLPSLRFDSFSADLAQMIAMEKRTGLTFAPEAGTERLRNAVNKRISDEKMLRVVGTIFDAGWKAVKLYFMVGLPTETPEDLEAVARLAMSMARLGRRTAGHKTRINVAVSAFIPKPHTPYQWERMPEEDELRQKYELLRSRLGAKQITFSWRDTALARLEAAFARGDRRLGEVILKAWQSGARFDAWSSEMRFDIWSEAWAMSEIPFDFCSIPPPSPGDPLPWQHIDTGVTVNYLLEEREETYSGCAYSNVDAENKIS